MARPLRIEFPGAIYHVTRRGNARLPIYEDDAKRRDFLDLLGGVVERFHWRCHGNCLMDHHYPLRGEREIRSARIRCPPRPSASA